MFYPIILMPFTIVAALFLLISVNSAPNPPSASTSQQSQIDGSLSKVELLLGSYFIHNSDQQKNDSIKNCNEQLDKVKPRTDKINKLQNILETALNMPICEEQKKFLRQAYKMFDHERKNRLTLLKIKLKFSNALKEWNLIQEGIQLFEENKQSLMDNAQKNSHLMSIFNEIDQLIQSFNTMPDKTIDINIQKCNEIIKLFDQIIEKMLRILFDFSGNPTPDTISVNPFQDLPSSSTSHQKNGKISAADCLKKVETLSEIQAKFIDASKKFEWGQEHHIKMKKLHNDIDPSAALKEWDSGVLNSIERGIKLFEENKQSLMDNVQENSKLMSKFFIIDQLIQSFNTMPDKTIEMKIQKCNEIIILINKCVEKMLNMMNEP